MIPLSPSHAPASLTLPAPLLLLRVIPPARSEAHGNADNLRMRSVMHSLALDARHPVALEIAGTGTQRSFFLRATTQAALLHARTQLQGRYPQAQFVAVPQEEDPLRLKEGETVSALELVAGEAAYLPLHTFDERALAQAGIDPVLGLLAALDALPAGVRAVAQLAMVPASPTWSRAHQRKAVESALEPERQQKYRERQTSTQGGAPTTTSLIGLSLLLAVIWLYPRYQRFIPGWVGPTLLHLMKGQVAGASGGPTLPTLPFLAVMTVLLVVALLLGWLTSRLRRLLAAPFSTPIYDTKLVGQKTGQMACHVRLCLYVIGPDAPGLAMLRERPIPHIQGKQTTLLQVIGCPLLALWHACIARWDAYQQRRDVLLRLVAAYRQYHLAAGNYFVARRLSRGRAERLLRSSRQPPGRFTRGWWQGVRRSRHLVSVESLAHLWHLPAAHLLPDLALVEQRRTRTLLVPPHLAEAGADQPLIGFSEHAGHHIPFGLPASCLLHHLLVLGKSGEGKSTMLTHLAAEAMREGGMVAIDPHGDWIEEILRLVPRERAEDVVLIDLSNTDYQVGFNPLDATLGKGRDKAVADLLATLSHIWAMGWGPRMENVFVYALRTLYQANLAMVAANPQEGPNQQYTLLDVFPILTDESFCHRLLDQIKDTDPYLARWWYTYYDPLSPTMQRDRSDPVLSKVARFESLLARRILGQGQSTIDLVRCIQERKIVLVKLAKGVVGEDAAKLLGATLLGLLNIAMEEQALHPQAERQRLPIMVDEFQVLGGVDWDALAELRKYGAAFVLATQSLESLKNVDAGLLPVVLANMKQYISFHVSAQDAWIVQKELGVEVEDLLELERYTCYIKLVYGDHRQATFSLRVLPPPPGDAELARHIRQYCQQRYGVPAAIVDEALKAALSRTYGASAGSASDEETPPPYGMPVSMTEAQPDHQQPSEPPVRQHQPGYRGRKAQVRRAKEQSQKDIKPMPWSETVGAIGPIQPRPAQAPRPQPLNEPPDGEASGDIEIQAVVTEQEEGASDDQYQSHA